VRGAEDTAVLGRADQVAEAGGLVAVPDHELGGHAVRAGEPLMDLGEPVREIEAPAPIEAPVETPEETPVEEPERVEV
jgi:hypothetical protein